MRPADQPQVHVAANSSHPGLVVIAVGTGRDSYNITPERADELAAQLTAAAGAARSSVAGPPR